MPKFLWSRLALLAVWCACSGSPAPVGATGTPPVAVPTATPDATRDIATADATTEDPAPALAPTVAAPAIVVERPACRSRPGSRLAIGRDGQLAWTDSTTTRTAFLATDPVLAAAAVTGLEARALAGGLAGWGHLSCDPTVARARCSMHPCAITVTVTTSDGTTAVASRTNDAAVSLPFARAVADIERTARVWRWSDPAVEPGADAPCASSVECTVVADSCRGLHAVRLGVARQPPTPDRCELASSPRGDVEPACVDHRCVLAPADADSQHCARARDCTPAWIACSGYTAVRTEFLRDIAIRNDHESTLPCPPASDPSPRPVPAAACLHGICVVRAHR